ncbi:coiled-coil domain-containing protein 103 [Condylostylus longicornis]|uniref:coiled-coil domain-containing protein 103 n=1 Tax=Condylostylus longicornis TaxID=2530218 RepID=UPI00244DEFDD|nr:coiled-coil domain-containing protein 103 [Condylostylus longicornis]
MSLEKTLPYECFNELTELELLKLRESCLNSLKEEKLYYIRNDAKIRAIQSTSSYDEFKDIVDGAHLKPLSKFDKNNASTKNRLWNSAAPEK